MLSNSPLDEVFKVFTSLYGLMNIHSYIDSIRRHQLPKFDNLIENLERIQEGWDHLYLQNNTSALTFEEAIASFEPFNNA